MIAGQSRRNVLIERVPCHKRDVSCDKLADDVGLAPLLYLIGHFSRERGVEREDTSGVK